jgi:hypothetical protein
MRRQGNRNFGVYAPPTGEDSIRRSTQIDLDIITRLNNIQSGRELGIDQALIDPNEGSVQRSSQVGLDLINRINNVSKVFEEMIRQGWGGNIASDSVTTSPSPSPSPSGSTSFPSLPLGNPTTAQIDRAMEFRSCGDFCVTLYNLWEGQWSTQRLCWTSSGGWVSDTWNDGIRHDTLNSWYESFYWNSTGMPEDYFIVDTNTRLLCFPQISSTPPSTLPPKYFDGFDVDSVMALW